MKKSIEFKIISIRTLQFATFLSQLKDKALSEKKKRMSISYTFGITPETRLLTSTIDILIADSDNPLIKIETEATYELSESTIDSLITNDVFQMSTEDVHYFTSLLYGATRGILICKLESTPLRNFILPPISMESVIREPLRIVLGNE